jgi:outer membrane protein
MALAAPVAAADGARIGLVDFQKFYNASVAGQKTREVMDRKGQSYEEELKSRAAQIEDEGKKLERESLVMSREMREEKERELRIMANDFKTLQKKRMGEFKELEQRLLKELRDEVLVIVEEIGEKGGYQLIMEVRGGGVLYAPETLDITEQVIQEHNARYAKEGGSPAAEKKD